MMIRALWSAATGMKAQQTNIDAIAHDLTNVNTNGYKKKHLNFVDLLYQNLRASGIQGSTANLPIGLQVGLGTRLAATTPVLTKGNPLETGIWSDMMIRDPGNSVTNFFGVTLPDGTRAYTRDGSFRVNKNGELTTAGGLSLNPPITGIPNGALDLSVTAGGYIQYRTAVGGTLQQIGPIQIYQFVNPAGLEAIGENLWVATDASGEATGGAPGTEGFGEILGGWIETSNVDAITEMVNMIAAQRAYEFNSRSIQTSDEMLQTVHSLKR